MIKESYRLNEKNLKTGKSIVFLVKKNCDVNSLTFKDIELDTKRILDKIGQDIV